jgi:LysM repeat protein
MRLPSLFPRKKLRATTARRGLGVPDEMDYEEMSEPNMKLSRALLIVLVLHVVAVAGIIAFNTIKNRQGIVPTVSTTKTTVPKATTPSVPAPETVKAKEEAPKAPVKEERKAIPVKPAVDDAPKAEPVKKTYVVAKGDTPVSIAKKFKITSDQLLTANKIEDARKLKIGQRLVIPAPKEKNVSKEKIAPKEKKKSKKPE